MGGGNILSLRTKTLFIILAALALVLIFLYAAPGYITPLNIYQIWGVVLLSAVIVTALVLLFLQTSVLSRLGRMNTMIKSIGKSGNISERLPVEKTSRELSEFSLNVNRMLDRLEQLQQKVLEKEAGLRFITDNMIDIICQLNQEGIIKYVSPSYKVMLGYEPKELLGKPLFDFIHPDDAGEVKKTAKKAIETLTVRRTEFRYRHANGKYIWVEAIGKILLNKHNVFDGGIVSCRDITERRAIERRLKFLSLHDALTGLYNRTYFEQEMQRLRSSRHKRAGLIICDVDGLKLYNDSLGHETGDLLLKSAAEVLKKSFRESDVIARIGGDEFAVLLPEATPEAVQSACDRIRTHIEEHNAKNGNLKLSISIGSAITDDLDNISTLFKEADDSMYREKLHQSQSTRSAIVQVLLKAMEERSFSIEGPPGRLENMVVKLAEAAGLSGRRIADIRLLTQFHDIGNVGISDEILFKKEPLTKADRAKLQSHCEIGNRIALSAPDLVPIADCILKHHEWWNGKGYPNKLSGEEIPLECRILAIAEAYNAMISGRPYRKAMSGEQAIKELNRFSGTQFDPALVDTFLQLLPTIDQ
jgi:diguanylate cyclase (GGDEF)-like protein/PAS domain S-box-containing protein